MPALIRAEGFYHRTLSANSFAGVNGAGLFDAVNNPAGISFDTTDLRHAASVACLRVNGDGVSQTNVMLGFTGVNVLVFSLYFKVVTNPAAESFMLCAATGVPSQNPGIVIKTDGTIGTFLSSAGPTGPQVDDGAWHRLDARFTTTGTTHTIDWAVDGTAQTQDSTSGLTNNNLMTDLVLGSTAASNDCDTKFSDVVISVTTGDHPIGGHKVLRLLPDSDDAASVYGANIMEQGTGVDLTAGNPGWQYLDDWPGTNADAENDADHVTQAAGTAANFVRVNFANQAEVTIWGAEMQVGMKADATTACNGTTRARYSDATTLNVYSGDPSEVNAHYRRVILDATKVDTDTEIDGLQADIGLSSDPAPDPEWVNLQVQYAVPFTDVFSTPIIVQDAAHAHTSDGIALTQHHVLAVQDARSLHASDAIALTQHNVLVVQDAGHSHAADGSLILTQHNVLAIQDALHGHAADNLTLVHNPPSGATLVIQDATHAHVVDNVVLGQHNILVVQDALHGHTADGLALVQHNILVVQDALHGHAADNVAVTGGELITLQQDFVRMRQRRPFVGNRIIGS